MKKNEKKSEQTSRRFFLTYDRTHYFCMAIFFQLFETFSVAVNISSFITTLI